MSEMKSKCETCPLRPEARLASLKEQYIKMARNPPLDSGQWADYAASMTDLEAQIRELGEDL